MFLTSLLNASPLNHEDVFVHKPLLGRSVIRKSNCHPSVSVRAGNGEWWLVKVSGKHADLSATACARRDLNID